MSRHSSFVMLCATFTASLLSGCVLTEEYNTQRFEAGGATCLSGKQVDFAYPPDDQKSAPYPHFPRYVSALTTLPVDPTDHDVIDFAQGDPFELILPEGAEVSHYGFPYERIYIGSDGTIAFGVPGTGNDTLIDAFSSDQVSLLPVDATVSGATVSYWVEENRVVVTYENVGGSTFQCELFRLSSDRRGVVFSYPVVSEDTRSGVVGIPSPYFSLGSDPDIERFVRWHFRDSNLCEDSPLNR